MSKIEGANRDAARASAPQSEENVSTLFGVQPNDQPNTAPPVPPLDAQATMIKPDALLRAAGALDAQVDIATVFQPGAKAPSAVLPRRTTLPAGMPAIDVPAAAPNVLDGATLLKGTTPLPLSSAPTPKRVTTASRKALTDIPQGTQFEAGEQDVEGDPGEEPLPPQNGDRVHHYELIRELGKGGMGSVFLARDNKLGRRVAIKFLHTHVPELTQRFILEARTTARFSHENIVTIYEVDQHHGQPFMVLEYLQGQPLTKLIADGKPMPPPRAVELMAPVIRALASAHAENIVHRDLKFDNVLVTDSGLIKVLDFGIAKVLGGEGRTLEAAGKKEKTEDAHEASAKGTDDTHVSKAKGPEESTDLTRHGTIMGTLAFMSPEQWGKGGPIDHRTDIWAAGVMLFRMLSGKHPLTPLVGMALAVTARLDEPTPKLQTLAPELPPELCAVVDRCLLKKKEDRFPDALSLLRALEPFLPGRYNRELKIDESPYAGLASFQEADADRFFGRSQEITALVNRVQDVPLLAVVGPSGTGKSSFVRAGLVPALKRSGQSWQTLVLRPGRNPLQALANIVAPLVSTSTNIQDDLQAQQKLVERLQTEPGYVGSVLRSRARREDKHLLVFVDQFEELYTLVQDPKERLVFTQCLASIADDATSPTRVVVSVRSDFLDRVSEDQAFMQELTKGLFFLGPPANDGLRDALVQPAEMAGYRFEQVQIVDDMLAHLASTHGALPLLQFAASKLWDTRDPARKLLTKASYDALGGIAGALASHAEGVLAELTPAARVLVRSVLLRLVTPDRTRAIVSLEDLRELSKSPAEVQRVVDQLVQARLLVVQNGSGSSGATVEIVHESLIHTWPQLKRWLDETGEDAAFLEQLRTATKQWQQKGKDAGLLWRGEVVDEAARFSRRYRGELPELQRAFLDAVFSQEKRAARRKRVLAIVGVVVLVAMVLAAGVALVVISQARGDALKQAEVARQESRKAHEAESSAKKSFDDLQVNQEKLKAATKLANDARVRAESAAEEVAKKAQELSAALVAAEQAKNLAASQRLVALAKAREAAAAQKVAQENAAEAHKLAEAEAERARKLEKQLGSPVIDDLR